MGFWDRFTHFSFNTMGKITDAVQGKGTRIQYFGKFRAYLFFNFILLAFTCALFAVGGLLRGEPYMLVILPAAIPNLLIAYFLWRGVEKKVPESERKTIFKIFCMTSVLVFGRVLLCFTVIFIPLSLALGGAFEFRRYVVRDAYGDHVMYLRYNMNGELVDAFGNKYV